MARIPGSGRAKICLSRGFREMLRLSRYPLLIQSPEDVRHRTVRQNNLLARARVSYQVSR
jgi:hypothetical protein